MDENQFEKLSNKIKITFDKLIADDGNIYYLSTEKSYLYFVDGNFILISLNEKNEIKNSKEVDLNNIFDYLKKEILFEFELKQKFKDHLNSKL